MKVLIKCFSQVKYAVGTSEFTLDLEPRSTTADLEIIIRKKVLVHLTALRFALL